MSQSLTLQKTASNSLTVVRSGANTGGSYTLPAATNATLGGVIVGSGLTVLANGTISVSTASIQAFTDTLYVPLAGFTWSALSGKPAFAAVATSGLYSDLTGTPNLSVYLTTANAAATYLTTTAAAAAYQPIGSYAAAIHTHAITDVTGLQTALDGKQATGAYVLTTDSRLSDARTPLAHTQAFSTITATPTTLAGYGITNGATTGANTFTGTQSLGGNLVTQAQLQAYRETVVTVASSAGALPLDLVAGNVFYCNLAQNTTVSFANVPASVASSVTFLLISNGFAVTWPASVKWPGGTAPTLTATAGKADLITFITRDGGTTWYAVTGGQNL